MKKLILCAALLCVCATKIFAACSCTYWIMGTYVTSTEDGSGNCSITCTTSDLYCFCTTTMSLTGDESILSITPTTLDNTPDGGFQTFDQLGLCPGAFITIQTFDAQQNIISTYSGNYEGMSLTTNADGSITSTISIPNN